MKKLIPAYIITFIFGFMLFVYEPLLMYSTNINDFWFDLKLMIVPVLEIFIILFLIGSIIFSLIYLINIKFFKKVKIYEIILLIGFITFFAFYIQGNYLIGNLPSLDGNVIDWSGHEIDNLITSSVWSILIFLAIFSVKKFSFEKTLKYATNLSLIVFAMLSFSLISTLFINDAFKEKDGIKSTMKNFESISKDKNFLIFVLDAFDSKTFNEVVNNNTEYKEIFNDFTYYSDTLSVYPFTRDSIPFILTGTWNKNEKSFSDYSTDAYNNSFLFKELENSNYQINIYDPSIIWDKEHSFEVDNFVSSKEIKIDLLSFFIEEGKYAFFKYMPYPLKEHSLIEYLDFDLRIAKSTLDDETLYMWNNHVIYNSILENTKLNKNELNQFHFIHVDGGHLPFNYDKNLNIIEDGTYEQKIEASLKLVKAYIDRLKNNDVYDNSVIIVMADHGYSEHILSRFNPVLLIKGINEHHEMIELDIPVSYEDLQEVYTLLLNGKKSTELFKNLNINRSRKLIWYEYSKENHMVEYETLGKAYDYSSYKKTGNVYDR